MKMGYIIYRIFFVMTNQELIILNKIAQTIYNKKGMNILALDVRKFSSLTDFVIIAEGTVDRHVIAIARAIEAELTATGRKPVNVEGLQEGDWVVLDYLQIMVHLFMPGVREKYQLEQLWQKGEIVDLNIVVSPAEAAGYSNY
jgi:ribosome-associated protein